jgi:quinol monooxygenase YgiN
MTIFRHYTLIAREGECTALKSALMDLAGKIAPLGGCEGTELYQDDADPQTFFFVERWASRDAHREAGKSLGKAAFAPLMAFVASPPVGRYLIGGSLR